MFAEHLLGLIHEIQHRSSSSERVRCSDGTSLPATAGNNVSEFLQPGQASRLEDKDPRLQGRLMIEDADARFAARGSALASCRRDATAMLVDDDKLRTGLTHSQHDMV